MTDKFKSRYVLGEGYPWSKGQGKDNIQMHRNTEGGPPVILKIPDVLLGVGGPKYRLVLERIDE